MPWLTFKLSKPSSWQFHHFSIFLKHLNYKNPYNYWLWFSKQARIASSNPGHLIIHPNNMSSPLGSHTCPLHGTSWVLILESSSVPDISHNFVKNFTSHSFWFSKDRDTRTKKHFTSYLWIWFNCRNPAELLQRNNLLSTTNFPRVLDNHLNNLGKIKG